MKEKALEERIKEFDLREDEEEYLLNRDEEIKKRLAIISDDNKLREIIYSLIGENIMEVNYSEEVILTFINACDFNFAYESCIYEALFDAKKLDEAQLLFELKLLAQAKNDEQVKYITILYRLKDFPLKNEFGKAILEAKTVHASKYIGCLTNLFEIAEAPYFYLEIARIMRDVKDTPIHSNIIDSLYYLPSNKWVLKNNCLQEAASKIFRCTKNFQFNFINRLFGVLNEDSPFNQIEATFKGADLILECQKYFQAEKIYEYLENCLRNDLEVNLAKAQIILEAKNDDKAFWMRTTLEKDSLLSASKTLDAARILNNSPRNYNLANANILLSSSFESPEYSLSAAAIVNEADEEEKASLVEDILCENNPYSLEIAAICNTLYSKVEMEALKLLNHNAVLNETGVSILMARIIGRSTDYNYDLVALYEILKDEEKKEKIVAAIKKELASSYIEDAFPVANLLNQVFGSAINANFELVEEPKEPKEAKSGLQKVLTKFKKDKK